MSDTQQIIIGDVKKSKSAVVRVTLSEYEGCHLVDLRLVETRQDGSDAYTKKGVALRVDNIGWLIQMLQKAESEARNKGWLSEPQRKAA